MKLYCDGFILSSGGGGFSVVDEIGRLRVQGMTERKGVTNNEVELQGLKNALVIAKLGDTISSDSKIVITWVRKARSTVRPDLNPIMVEAHKHLTSKGVLLVWEGREHNLAGKLNERLHKYRKKMMSKGESPVNAVKSFLSHEASKTSNVPGSPPTHEYARIPHPGKARIALSQAEHLGNAIMKRRDGVPVVDLSMEERIILESAQF